MELLYAWARRALNSQKRRFPARAAARLRDLGGHLRALDARDGGADDENLRREGAQARWDAELQAKAEATNTVVWVVESLADEKPPTLGELRGLQVAFVAQRALDHADELLADAQHAGSMGVVVRRELHVCERALAAAREERDAAARLQRAVGITMAMEELRWWALRGDGALAQANVGALGRLWVALLKRTDAQLCIDAGTRAALCAKLEQLKAKWLKESAHALKFKYIVVPGAERSAAASRPAGESGRGPGGGNAPCRTCGAPGYVHGCTGGNRFGAAQCFRASALKAQEETGR
jgi:hypothetical protein